MAGDDTRDAGVRRAALGAVGRLDPRYRPRGGALSSLAFWVGGVALVGAAIGFASAFGPLVAVPLLLGLALLILFRIKNPPAREEGAIDLGDGPG